MSAFWSFFIHRSAFSTLLVVAMIAFGFYSLASIPKESAPEVQVPVAVVTTIFPGASPRDVEKLVSDVIEDALSGVDNLDTLTSTSRESISVVVAEFDARADIDTSIQDVKDEVDGARPKLPAEAEDPIVSDVNFVDQPILIVSIISDLAPKSLITLADDVADELESITGVSRVAISGIRERQVHVVVSREALQNFGISVTDVIFAISRANAALPVGTITLNDVEYAVRFEGDIKDPTEIGDIAILTVAGEPLYVRDVAFVSDGVSRASTFSRASIDGHPAEQSMTLSVFKRRGGDITSLSRAVQDRLEELEKTILSGTRVLVSFDVGTFVREDLINLSLTGLQTVVLVMIILLVALGWREALIAGSAIPLSFLIAFIGLNASGNTINFVSLFSLILAVGILVDSAIVIVEGMHTRLEGHVDKKKAALATIREFHTPLTSGTMTTIAVFFPLFFISGVTGQFIASIPFTIIFVLLASLIVALGIVPLIAAAFLSPRTAKVRHGDSMDQTIGQDKKEYYTQQLRRWYERALGEVIGSRKRENFLFMFITLLFVVSLALPALGIVKTIFFPGEDNDFLFVELEEVQGTPLAKTDFLARAVEEVLYSDPRIDSFVTTIGAGSSFTEGIAGAHRANITVLLKEKRQESSAEILSDLRKELHAVAGSRIRIDEPSSGPPTGDPVVITFLGDTFEGLQEAVIRAQDVLAAIPGAIDVTTSLESDNVTFILDVDRAKAHAAGLDPQLIAATLRSAVHGTTATTIQSDGDDIDVIVTLNVNPEYTGPDTSAHTDIDTLLHLLVKTQRGEVILGSVLTARIAPSTAVILHEDEERKASVSSALAPGVLARDVTALFEERFDKTKLSEGVTMRIGGENEDVDQSFQDMFVALIAGMLLITAILVLQFNSYRQTLFIISVVPPSLIGIFFGLAITGKTLSFPSIMGFIALSGIVVNNSIIMVDTINKIKKAYPERLLQDSIIEGASLRLRPILLTTLTTVIGIIPLIYASAIWSPLAFSIMFGLTFAVIITLVLVPVLYHRFSKK